MKKVRTNNNPADPLQKALNGEKVMMYMAVMGFDVDSGRATTAPMFLTNNKTSGMPAR